MNIGPLSIYSQETNINLYVEVEQVEICQVNLNKHKWTIKNSPALITLMLE